MNQNKKLSESVTDTGTKKLSEGEDFIVLVARNSYSP